MRLGEIERCAVALGARIDHLVRWHGGDLDRLVNGRHSALHEAFAQTFGRLPGWTFVPELSFAIAGERGVIDVVGRHVSGVMLIVELKSELVDLQELLGTLDRKVRLARRIATSRGWPATEVGAWLVLAEGRTNRRHVEAHAALLRAALPDRGVAMRRWLHQPASPIRALTFLSYAPGVVTRRTIVTRSRVRLPRAGADGRPTRP